MTTSRHPPVRGPSDDELIAACRKGRREAFGELVTRYQDRVFHLAYRLTSSRDDAGEAAQEAFLRAYRSLDAFRGESAFYTWLFRITVNVARNRQRYSAARPPARSIDATAARDPDGNGGPTLADKLKARVPDPVDEASRLERKELVEAALAGLDEEQRMMIVLRDMEGRSYSEIAELLDCPRGTVKSRIHRARMALRDMLAPVLADAYGTAG